MSPVKFRRIVGGASLVLFPLLLLASEALDPAPRDQTPASMFDTATNHEGALVASALLLLASSVLMIPAVFSLAQAVQARGAGLIHAGTFFGILGAFGHGLASIYFLIVSTMPGGDRAEMIALLERIDESAAAGAVVLPLILSFAVSILLLSLGAWRSGFASTLIPIAAVAGVFLEVASPALPDAFALVKQGLVLVSFGWLGLRIIGMSDEAWARSEPEAPREVGFAQVAAHS